MTFELGMQSTLPVEEIGKPDLYLFSSLGGKASTILSSQYTQNNKWSWFMHAKVKGMEVAIQR